MIKENINENINLIIEPTDKFKSVNIRIDFASELPPDVTDAQNLISHRALMAAVLEVSSKKYPNIQTLNDFAADHFGADMGVSLFKLGLTHHLQMTYQFIADKYLDTNNQLTDAIEFLEQQLLSPNFSNEQSIEIEKNNLINLLQNQDENLNSYSKKKLFKNFYDDKRLTIDVNGEIDSINKINQDDLKNTHQAMIGKDKITIIVVGDIDSKQVINLFKKSKLVLADRNPNLDYFYQQDNHQFSYIDEVKNINQSKLSIAYNLSVDQKGDQRFVAYLFNSLLGGTPQSKLFTNVREAESLAYSIGSVYDRFTNAVIVQAGIDQANYKKTDLLIDEQIKQIQNGDFDDRLIEDIKRGIINDNLSLSDSLGNLSYKLLMSELLGGSNNEQTYSDKINQITNQQIVELSKTIIKQDEFLLTNEK